MVSQSSGYIFFQIHDLVLSTIICQQTLGLVEALFLLVIIEAARSIVLVSIDVPNTLVLFTMVMSSTAIK